MVKRKHLFTLIELFLTLTLIALVGSFLIVQIKPLLDHHHFIVEVGELKREVSYSKKIALAANTDVELYVYPQGKKGIKLVRVCEDELKLPATFLSPVTFSHLMSLGAEKEKKVLFTSSGTVVEAFDLDIQCGRHKEKIVFGST